MAERNLDFKTSSYVSDYIRSNGEFVKSYLSEKLPRVGFTDWEGTYLIWLDFPA